VKSGEKGKGKREKSSSNRFTFPFSLFPFPFILVLSCTSITTRPNLLPFPTASVDTVVGDPSVILEAARDTVLGLGMTLRAASPAEGYLETRWFDPATRRSQRNNTNARRLVRMRVWTDLVTPSETQVVVETVYRRNLDPSVPDREVERVSDPGTPGDSLTRSVSAAVRKRFARAAPKTVR
jgi:hypothetical protein